jgi:hypothetical protein
MVARPDGPGAPGTCHTEAIVEQRKLPSFTWVYLILIALSLVLVVVGAFHQKPGTDWVVIALGILGLIIVGATWPLSEVLAGERSEPGAEQKSMNIVVERLEQISVLMNAISDQQLLSDRAKAVAYREKDRDALRRAIQEELAKQDWDAAMALANDIESEFGYKEEANRFREEVRNRRQDAVRKQIQEVVAIIDRHTRSEQWNGALREAERLMGMFPDNEQVKNLPVEIDARRQAHKKQLLDSWNDAVARHDVDGSIEILKQLDTYLTPAEAEGMQETARQVFKEKLNLLSKQFSDAVRDHKWIDAMRVGESISREFPNTRIAQEVREKMETLRQRANEPLTAASALPPGSPPIVPAGA